MSTDEKESVDEKPMFSVDETSEKLYEAWAKVQALLQENATENIKSRTKQLVVEIHKCVDLLISLSNFETFDNLSQEFCIKTDMFNKIYSWTGQHRECLKQMACEQLNYFLNIVTNAGIKLLKSKQFVIPLTLLLLSLKPTDKRKIPPDIENLYVNILYQLAVRISDSELFHLLANDLYTDEGFQIEKYTFFELLILYTHNLGSIGDKARDGLLLCMKVSNKQPDFELYISQESACVIIAGGLSARYSSLPTTLDIHSEEWHGITKKDLNNLKELEEFLMALDFCCQVSKVSGEQVKNRLALLIHDGFLKSVLAPALNQISTEAQIAVMAYLDLFLRSITNDRVMEVFLRVLLTEAYDNKPLINLLIYHINSTSIQEKSTPQNVDVKNQLSMVAMQLFKTLLQLNCEDVIFHLIFRYLLPCHHILPNQKRTIKEMDFYCKSATMFLYLTPQCCLETNKCDGETEDSPQSQRRGSPVSQHSAKTNSTFEARESPVINRKTSTVSSVSMVSRSSSGSTHSELKQQEIVDFMAYLHDAKSIITSCKKACQCWSAVYDGMDVITENPHPRGSRSSIPSPRSSLHADSPAFTRTLSNLSTDSDVGPGVFDLATPSQYTTSCLGPFLNALFDKIESMLENNLYVNLLLTSLVTRLACYPQPLLRSFLLNSNLVIRPGVRSLSQLLSQLSRSADAFIFQLDDYKVLITKAKQNLLRREQRKFNRLSQEVTPNRDASGEQDEESVASINLNTKTGAGRFELQKKEPRDKGHDRSFGPDELVSLSPLPGVNTSQIKKNDSSRSNSFTPHGGVLHPAITKKGGKSQGKVPSKKDLLDMRKKNPTAIKNAVYCVIILEEFMKELAAVSIEQTLL